MTRSAVLFALPLLSHLAPPTPCSVHEMEARQQLFDDRMLFKLGPAAAGSAAAAASWGLAPAAAVGAAEQACCIEIVREGLAPAGP